MDFRTLDDFWPFYLSQHLKPGTRRLHFAGTTAGLLLLGAAGWRCDARLLAAALAASYGLAWLGHFLVEKNSPATFRFPLLSFRADIRMYALSWLGRLDGEISRLQEDIRRHRGP